MFRRKETMFWICIIFEVFTINMTIAENDSSSNTTTEANSKAIEAGITFRDILLEAIANLEKVKHITGENETDEAIVQDDDLLDDYTSSDEYVSFKLYNPEENNKNMTKGIVISTLRLNLKSNNTKKINNDSSLNFDTKGDSNRFQARNTTNWNSIQVSNDKKIEGSFQKSPKVFLKNNLTTKMPILENDENNENSEVVNKEDIKIYQAPLLTAFTVRHNIADTKTSDQTELNFPNSLAFQDLRAKPTSTALLTSHFTPTKLTIPQESNALNSPLEFFGATPVPESLEVNEVSIVASESKIISPIPQENILNNTIPKNMLKNQHEPNFKIETLDRVLLQRQNLLEDQVKQLKEQSRLQQEQILLQQRLLQEHQKNFFSINQDTSKETNQNSNNFLQQKPQLDLKIFSSISKPFDAKYTLEQALPVLSPNDFHSELQPFSKTESSIQILPSNQFSFVENSNQLFGSSPDLPIFQLPPQKDTFLFGSSNQNLANINSLNLNPSQKTRLLRQENEIGNFGHNFLAPPIPHAQNTNYQFQPWKFLGLF